jgi:hypothetical protein
MKRCTVHVSTSLLASSQPVSVLSAALSSRGRISRDKDDAGRISGMLDEVRGIEAGSRLADLLRLLNPGTELHPVDDEDVLDVSIAYLRRVHLRSTMDALPHRTWGMCFRSRILRGRSILG